MILICRALGTNTRGCKCPTCQPFLYSRDLNPQAIPIKTVYRVHLNGGDQDYSTKEKAFREARNIGRAAGAHGSKAEGVWVTEEFATIDHAVIS